MIDDYIPADAEPILAVADDYGPRVPDTWTPDNDVNPMCGCHRRAMCVGCGVCTSCDGCYCGED